MDIEPSWVCSSQVIYRSKRYIACDTVMRQEGNDTIDINDLVKELYCHITSGRKR